MKKEIKIVALVCFVGIAFALFVVYTLGSAERNCIKATRATSDQSGVYTDITKMMEWCRETF